MYLLFGGLMRQALVQTVVAVVQVAAVEVEVVIHQSLGMVHYLA